MALCVRGGQDEQVVFYLFNRLGLYKASTRTTLSVFKLFTLLNKADVNLEPVSALAQRSASSLLSHTRVISPEASFSVSKTHTPSKWCLYMPVERATQMNIVT